MHVASLAVRRARLHATRARTALTQAALETLAILAYKQPITRAHLEAIRGVARADQIPGNRPLWTSVASDRENRIWVSLPGPGADVASLDVFSPDGVLLGKVPAPRPGILDAFWTRDRAYLRDLDVG